ncbi:MAG: diguanylate cyclase domain-containing protein [Nitriliruptorales bacterium]
MLVEPIASAVDTILIVDDDTARAARIGQVLSLHGYGVLHACGDHAAIDLAREHRPPLVLLSVTTARGEQADLCRRLQSDWRCGSPSIIVLAGRADVADFASGLVTTADDYVILEPFDAVRVLTRVGATLRRAEEMRASSPLTGLPGNTAIETELQRRTALGEPMALLYVDLDNFKAYNDHYGFLRGDAVIRGMADVLRTAAEKRPGTFLGHVGGDDFVVVSAPEEAEDIADEVISRFDDRAPSFYDPEDAARGEIEVVDRQGNPHNYPLVTVSIGIARTLDGQISDHRALVDIATEMKQVAKNEHGSAAAVDRRTKHDRGVAPRPSLQRGSTPPRLGPGQLPARRSHRNIRMPRLGTGVSALVLMLALVVSPTATVFAATNATPGETLYSAKLKLEAVQLTLTMNPLREAALHLEFANRRLTELTELLAAGNPKPELVEAVSQNLREHVESAVKELNQVEGTDIATRAKELVVQDQVQLLNGLVTAQCAGLHDAAVQNACTQLQLVLHEAVVEIMPPGALPVVIPNPGGILLAIPPASRASAEAGSQQTTTASNSQANETSGTAPAGTDAGTAATSNEAPASGPAGSSDPAPADPAPAEPPPANPEPVAAPPPGPEQPAPPEPTPTPTPTETATAPYSAPPPGETPGSSTPAPPEQGETPDQ